MQNNIFTYWIIAIVIFFIVLWIWQSIANFNKMDELIQSYIEKENSLFKEETLSRDFYKKEELMRERAQMHYKYPELNELALAYKHNKEDTRKKLKRNFLKYGFLYNLWHS